MDEKIRKASQQMDANQKRCETEIERIRTDYDSILKKLKMKQRHEKHRGTAWRLKMMT